MRDAPTDPPVVCTLTEAERAGRSDRIPTSLTDSFREATERDDGYTLTFAGGADRLEELSSFVADELACCSFANYEIAVAPPYEETQLTIRGPEGTKTVLGDALVQHFSREDPDRTTGDLRRNVRSRYRQLATRATSESAEDTTCGCCGGSDEVSSASTTYARRLGYSAEDLDRVEGGVNLGLGCGNPLGIADLSAGETVLDLGSGGGFDCFLAAHEVGPTGQVIGVDMTAEMIERAREQTAKHETDNVEFRLGEIEHLPIADASIDVILSNCVINLSPDKPQVFREAFRVLRPGGRLAISDVVQQAPIPSDVRTSPGALSGCIAGATTIDELESMLREVGFVDVSIRPEDESRSFIRGWDDDHDLSDYIVSAVIEASRPV